MFKMISIKLFVVLSCFVAIEVSSHGMLIDPPNRGSLWRFGYPTEINYDDNGLFCGGQQVQWEINGGRCGVCGDDYRSPQPRANENTGTFGEGFVVGTYTHSSNITTTVTITANHRGYFTFSLCELTDPDTYEKEECFNDIKLANGDSTYVLPSADVGNYTVELQLPYGVVCERCVLRWQYTAGNSWGTCEDGSGAVGCGPQETFRTCSDIRIISVD